VVLARNDDDDAGSRPLVSSLIETGRLRLGLGHKSVNVRAAIVSWLQRSLIAGSSKLTPTYRRTNMSATIHEVGVMTPICRRPSIRLSRARAQ